MSGLDRPDIVRPIKLERFEAAFLIEDDDERTFDDFLICLAGEIYSSTSETTIGSRFVVHCTRLGSRENAIKVIVYQGSVLERGRSAGHFFRRWQSRKKQFAIGVA